MYQKKTFEVEIHDSVIEEGVNGQPVIYVKNAKSDKPLYKVTIFLDGNDLPYVESVEYELHPSFKKRFNKIERTLNNATCTFTIWTWGIFEVKAVIKAKDGSKFNLSHQLTYGDEIANSDYKIVSK